MTYCCGLNCSNSIQKEHLKFSLHISVCVYICKSVSGGKVHYESTGFQECVTKRGLLETSALSGHCPLQKLLRKVLIASDFTFFSLQTELQASDIL